MELLTGGELFERLRQSVQFKEKEAASIMKSLISAIQIIHSQDIVHRDLKPENILFSDSTPQAKVKIIDFGFARLKPEPATLKQLNENKLQASNKSTMMQTPCFTLSFGAPEVLYQALCINKEATTPAINTKAQSSTNTNQQASNQSNLNLASYSNGYDESCDLWSLGVILYTMLCGRVPFSGDLTDETSIKEEEKQQIETNEDESANKFKRKKLTIEINPQKPSTITNPKPNRHLVTQEKIIERIRNASSSLDFKEKSWHNVSDSAKQLLRGLLNVDPKKRMKLKDLSRHDWIKSNGCCAQSSKSSQITAIVTPTPSVCSSQTGDSSCISSLPTTSNDTPESGIIANKFVENNLLREQFSLALNAFHTAEQKGLFSIQLKDVFEAPLAQRRHHKRSTSSNASSESSVSTISICSSLSTSTTNNTNNLSVFNSNTTPTKKCPLSCGKLTEQTVFNFSESYVSDYLKQQKNSNNIVFNRPITRSFTHHTNKFNATNDSVPFSDLNSSLIPPSSNCTTNPKQTTIIPSANVFNFNFDSNSNNSDLNQSSSMSFFETSSNNSMTNFSNDNQIDYSNYHLTSSDDLSSKQNNCMHPPLSKRLKRVSTILIDD